MTIYKKTLTPRELEAVKWVDQFGMTYTDTAKKIGVSNSRARQLYIRARKKIDIAISAAERDCAAFDASI